MFTLNEATCCLHAAHVLKICRKISLFNGYQLNIVQTGKVKGYSLASSNFSRSTTFSCRYGLNPKLEILALL